MTQFDAISTANLVPTPELVERLIEEKPRCWSWAAFVSVLFQRWAAVEERKVRQVLGARSPTGPHLNTGHAVKEFVSRHMRDCDDLTKQCHALLADPSFRDAFGAPDDESTADAAGIVLAANRVGDFYVRFLELAEECQRCSVPEQYTEFMDDCTRWMNLPLHDFGEFLNDVLMAFEELQRRVALGERYIRLDPVSLPMTTDDQLIWSIMDRLRAIN